jgi:protein SCO1/2
VQEALPAGSPARLLTVTSDPEFDTPGVLRAYAEKYRADTNRWQFVTGSKAEIRRLVTKELLLVMEEKPEAERASPEDLFLHSTLIVVMDSQGRLRTAVEGLEHGAARRVVQALRQLEREAGG